MAYLHSKNVIRCKLKPSNVLLDRLLRPRIGGFRFGKFIYLKRWTNIIWQPSFLPYMAPELINEENEYSKEAADVYSFGVIMVEVVTASTPFNNMKTRFGLMNAVFHGYRPDIPDMVPPGCRQLIKACWAQIPDERPPFATIISDLKAKFILEDTDEAAFEDFVRDVGSGKLRDE
jgi:serine/threonine protein kinase